MTFNFCVETNRLLKFWDQINETSHGQKRFFFLHAKPVMGCVDDPDSCWSVTSAPHLMRGVVKLQRNRRKAWGQRG